MIYIETNSFKPEWNLACEEYFLKNSKEPILMLWQNEPTIVVGRFQNTLEEINENYVNENNINVIRRITGGGAVYQDFGNLCYSFIARDVAPENADFSIYAKPIVTALGKIGVGANTSGRNDILIDGMKISGTAMKLHKDSLLFHGTLLFDSDLTVLSNALNVNPLKIESKAIKSVRSRVTNIKNYIENDKYDVKKFKEILKEELISELNVREYPIAEEDFLEIEKLVNDKYKSWEWVVGSNPKYTIKNTMKFDAGILEVNVDVKEGIIKACLIRGDFLGLYDLREIETSLENIRFDKKCVEDILEKFDIKRYFNGIKIEEILKCIFK